jgi:hypothetical protein
LDRVYRDIGVTAIVKVGIDQPGHGYGRFVVTRRS